MMACLPIGGVYMTVAWLVLTWGLPVATEHDDSLRSELRNRLQSLGRASTAERRMLVVFAATALLWVFRKPLTIGMVTLLPGWSLLSESWFGLLGTSMTADQLADDAGNFVNDSTVAMLMAVLDGIQNKIDPGDPLDKDIYDLPPEELAKVPQTPGSLREALNALERDHDYLLKGDVFTSDVIETWISYKIENEVQAVELRPHPWEFALYYDI